MKYRIHYRIGEISDSVIIEGGTYEEIRIKAFSFLNKKGVPLNADVWSEAVE